MQNIKIGFICFVVSLVTMMIVLRIARVIREKREFKERQRMNLERMYFFQSRELSQVQNDKRRIGDILELTKSYVCDNICKWPCECSDEEEMNEICDKCQFNKNCDKITEYVKN